MEKKILLTTAIVVGLAGLPAGAMAAYSFSTLQPNPTLDPYYGSGMTGDESNPYGVDGIQDAYGAGYEVDSLESSFGAGAGNSMLTVQVNTDFDSATSPYFAGDLLFDTSWAGFDESNPSDFLLNDDMYNGDWTYVVHIDDLSGNTSDASIYKIDYGAHSGFTKEDIFYRGTDRQRQEVRLGEDPYDQSFYNGYDWDSLDSISKLESYGVVERIGDATWSAVGGESISFSFDLLQSTDGNALQSDLSNSLLSELGVPVDSSASITGDGGFQLAYHWTMSCGNDVIETVQNYEVSDASGGGGDIPEPATLALFGAGLAGLVGRRRLRGHRAA